MSSQVVCFGEILFDIIDGSSKPGGAPFNVAYHLKQAGTASFLISCVGNDPYGKELLDIVKTWGLDTTGIAISDSHKTGEAIVKKGENGLPEYDLVYPAAWDYIPWKAGYMSVIANSNAFVFGSLSSRNTRSYDTLKECLEYSSLNVFDINIRPPYFDQLILEELLQKTHILKLNDTELALLSQWYDNKEEEEKIQVEAIRQRFNIDEVIVTKGEEGASYYSDEDELHRPAMEIQVANTVGSGDAFLAGFLSKRLDNSSTIEACFLEGIKKGGYVASQYEACPSYEGYLEMFRN
ncbi:carbohydrate kinase family protein [Sphingobacterium haloxyli]|uniref:Carbohydrate kinase n=1 Tax=Sphingobacterium haloxyli TaxID=2100533 RepID=A0A2S9J6M3_9SPHI|nr:carbohydrate kinase [Sphingobacterium haloxyli]PRD48446.1 carbohydrate kinase [Sphingobacterium haloxyli]